MFPDSIDRHILRTLEKIETQLVRLNIEVEKQNEIIKELIEELRGEDK